MEFHRGNPKFSAGKPRFSYGKLKGARGYGGPMSHIGCYGGAGSKLAKKGEVFCRNI